MYCPYCGKMVEDSARFCPQCGKALGWSADKSAESWAESKGNRDSDPWQPMPPNGRPDGDYLGGTPYQAQTATINVNQYDTKVVDGDAPSLGWAIISFFFSLVGFILFLVWRTSYPRKAKSCLKGALYGILFMLLAGWWFGGDALSNVPTPEPQD